MIRPLPSTEFLKQIFTYDGESGKLYWKIDRSNNARAGQEAGAVDSKGYRFVRIQKQPYRTHRIIWKILTNNDPQGCIDHLNGDKSDNRFENLRDVTHQDNLRNCKKRKDNTSGVTGVSWSERRKVWRSYIHIDGTMKELGQFKDKQRAVDRRDEYAKQNGFLSTHGRN